MSDAYRAAGVNIEAGSRAVRLMEAAVRSTYGPEVLAGIGNFGGLYSALALKGMSEPVLVSSTDGVGTKTKVAASLGCFRSLGLDIVNHCIDDILVQGAGPLFFLDYIGTSRLRPEVVAEIVGGAAEACREAGCALLGGETAEMPGVYEEDEWDVVGTIVGVVERAAIIDGAGVAPGDVVLGLASSGLHTNGYSLARAVLGSKGFESRHPDLPRMIGDELLEPHRSYLGPVRRIARSVSIKALAHITGGGFPDNLPRVLPDGVAVSLQRGSWPVLPIFHVIQEAGGIDESEMYHVFNMGIGMVLVVDAQDEPKVRAGEPVYRIGEVVPRQPGAPQVTLVD